jgi:hypothetical protein
LPNIRLTRIRDCPRWLRRLDRAHKLEGVDARLDGDTIRPPVITDADDPDVTASLYAAATPVA